MAKGDWWFKFDFGKWRNDTAVRLCSFETRAFWLECLCVMHEIGGFELSGTYEELSRIIGCTPEFVAKCSAELMRYKTADVTLGNGVVTIVSRRLRKEANSREKTRLRVEKYRRNKPVTGQSKSKSKKKEKKEDKNKTDGVSGDTPKPDKKGSRIPDDFSVSLELQKWAREKFPELDLYSITEYFIDWWKAQPGQKGVKLDWDLTWKNWIRREAEKRGTHGNFNGRNGSNGKTSNAEIAKQWEQRLRDIESGDD